MANPFGSLINKVFGPPIPVQEQMYKDEEEQRKRLFSAPAVAAARRLAGENPNADPGALMRQFIQSPEFMNAFDHGAGTVEDYGKIFKELLPPQQDAFAIQTAKGGHRQLGKGPAGNQPVLAEEGAPPTAESQNTQNYLDQLPTDIRREVIKIAGQKIPSEKQMALAQFLASRASDPNYPAYYEIGQKILSGTLQVTNGQDMTGRTRPVVVDQTDLSFFTGDTDSNLPEGSAPTGLAAPVRLPTAPQSAIDPADHPEVRVPTKYASLFDANEQAKSLPPGLLTRMAWTESRFDPKAVSDKGAQGIMQFMPATAKDYNVFDPTIPEFAIPAAAEYVDDLRTRYTNNAHGLDPVYLAVAAYNWGLGNVDKWLEAGADPGKMPEETRDYLRNVLGPKQFAAAQFPEAAQAVGEAVPVEGQEAPMSATALEGAFHTGPVPSALALINQTLGTFIPAISDRMTTQGRQAIARLQEDTKTYFEARGRETSNADIQRILGNFIPSLGVVGITENAYSSVQKLISLREFVETYNKQDRAIVADWRNKHPDMVRDAMARIARAESIFSQIGTRAEQKAALAKAEKTNQLADGWNHGRDILESLGWTKATAPNEGEQSDDDIKQRLDELQQELDAAPPGPQGDASGGGFFVGSAQAAEGDQDVFAGPDREAIQEEFDTLNNELYARNVARDSGAPRPVVDFGISFVAHMSDVLALPFETALAISRDIGLKSIQGNSPPPPGAVQRQFARSLRSAGVPAAKVRSFMGELGGDTADAAGLAVALLFGTEAIIARGGTGLISKAMQGINSFIRSNPIQFMVGDVGGATAARKAEEAGAGPVGQIGAGIAGGGLASGAFGVARRGVTRAGRSVAGGLGLRPAAGEAVLPPVGGPGAEAAKSYGEQVIAADLKKVQDDISDAISSVGAAGDTKVAQAQVRRALTRSEKVARRLERSYWSKVDMQQSIPTSPLRLLVATMARELKDAPESRPDKYIRMIMSKGWGMGSKSLQRLDSLKGAIARDRLAEDAKNLSAPGSANKSLVRNYARLEELIDHAMMDGLPNNQPLKSAIAFSRELNKIYHKSELGPLLSKERGGAERIPSGQTVEHLLGQYEGLKAVTATGRRALIADTDSAVRQIYQEIAMADPKKGIKFVQANEREIRALTGASADLQQSATRLSDALNREKLVGQSALQRFTKMDPQVGVSRVWTDKNPSYVASGILARLRGDTDAVKGFRTGILNELLSRTQGGNLVEMAKAVKDPKIDRLLKTVLEPDSYARLNKIVDLGAELAGGNSQMLLRRIPFRGTVGIALAGRFMGALIGREMGVSTLQGQSVLANAGQKMVERVFKNVDPQTLFAKALTDPKWERLLELRVNPEPKGLRRLARYVAMLTGAYEGATQEDE